MVNAYIRLGKTRTTRSFLIRRSWPCAHFDPGGGGAGTGRDLHRLRTGRLARDRPERVTPNVGVDSYGPALQGGVNHAIMKGWVLFASVAQLDVKSKLVAIGSMVLTTTIDFKPWVYSFGG